MLGYYGFKNSGDDALLLSIIKELREKKNDIKLGVLSNEPEKTAKEHGVKAYKRNNPFSLLFALISSRMLLVGGGTLIQDKTSTKSLLYYLYVINAALLLGKKVMLYANGIGPIKEENKKLTTKILNKVNVITLRDEISKQELDKLFVTKPRIKVCADPAFLIDVNQDLDISALLEGYKIPKEKKYFCVSVRDTKKDASIIDEISKVCDYIYNEYEMTPVFLPFQKARDIEVTEKIRKNIKAPSAVFDTEDGILPLLKFISGAEFMIGMRLHSLIYSVVCNVPVVGIAYDPKVAGFMEYLGHKNYLDLDDVNEEKLIKLCKNSIENKEKIKQELKISCEGMRQKANQNATEAINLLEAMPKGKK